MTVRDPGERETPSLISPPAGGADCQTVVSAAAVIARTAANPRVGVAVVPGPNTRLVAIDPRLQSRTRSTPLVGPETSMVRPAWHGAGISPTRSRRVPAGTGGSAQVPSVPVVTRSVHGPVRNRHGAPPPAPIPTQQPPRHWVRRHEGARAIGHNIYLDGQGHPGSRRPGSSWRNNPAGARRPPARGYPRVVVPSQLRRILESATRCR